MRGLRFLSIGVFLSACGGAPAVDRAAVYGEVGRNVAAPAYVALVERTGELDAAATAYCADATSVANLGTLRAVLVDAHLAYQRTRAFEFGSSPTVLSQVPLYLDSFPLTLSSGTTTTTISDLLMDVTPLDFAALPARVQGFYAVEFLLFDQAAAVDAAAQFSNGALGARRCAYLLGLTARIDSLAKTASATWSPVSETSFDQRIANPGSAGSPYSTLSSTTTDLVVRQYTLFENLADMRLGAGLGILAAGATVPNPEAVPGYLGHLTKNDLLAALDGFESFYLGTSMDGSDGRGLQDIVRARSHARDAEVLARLAASRAAIHAIAGDIDAAIVDAASPEYASVLGAYEALKSLQTTLAVGVGPTLGISSAAFLADGD